jgi:hypothetical protein
MELKSLLKKRPCSIEEGLCIFDSLEPVTVVFMKGQKNRYFFILERDSKNQGILP